MSEDPGQPIDLGIAASSQIHSVLMKDFIRLFHAVYLRRYFQLCPGGKWRVGCWRIRAMGCETLNGLFISH